MSAMHIVCVEEDRDIRSRRTKLRLRLRMLVGAVVADDDQRKVADLGRLRPLFGRLLLALLLGHLAGFRCPVVELQTPDLVALSEVVFLTKREKPTGKTRTEIVREREPVPYIVFVERPRQRRPRRRASQTKKKTSKKNKKKTSKKKKQQRRRKQNKPLNTNLHFH